MNHHKLKPSSEQARSAQLYKLNSKLCLGNILSRKERRHEETEVKNSIKNRDKNRAYCMRGLLKNKVTVTFRATT